MMEKLMRLLNPPRRLPWWGWSAERGHWQLDNGHGETIYVHGVMFTWAGKFHAPSFMRLTSHPDYRQHYFGWPN